jgi:hypothetical protein
MYRLIALLTTLFALSGCGGGGSGSGSLFSSGLTSLASGSTAVSSAVGSSAATAVVNPEPSTMLLFSVGVVGLAAAMLRKKKK